MGKQDLTGVPTKKLSEAPCAELYQASLACLDRENYNKPACEEYFELYKACKKQEVAGRGERRLEERRQGKGWFS